MCRQGNEGNYFQQEPALLHRKVGGGSLFYWEDAMSKGQIFRMGVRIKEAGERLGHVRVLGIHVFSWFCGAVVRLGYSISDSVRNCPISEF